MPIEHDDAPRVVSVTRDVSAPADRLFAEIADPARQPAWDGNDNLVSADEGQRVRAIGDVFRTWLTNGSVRENHVVELEEDRRIAWRPADEGREPAGHLWRWELEPVGPARTRVTHTYDWSGLTDESRVERARGTGADHLRASLDRLADLVEHPAS